MLLLGSLGGCSVVPCGPSLALHTLPDAGLMMDPPTATPFRLTQLLTPDLVVAIVPVSLPIHLGTPPGAPPPPRPCIGGGLGVGCHAGSSIGATCRPDHGTQRVLCARQRQRHHNTTTYSAFAQQRDKRWMMPARSRFPVYVHTGIRAYGNGAGVECWQETYSRNTCCLCPNYPTTVALVMLPANKHQTTPPAADAPGQQPSIGTSSTS